MKTKTIELFQFDELSGRAKEKARDWYRSGNWEDTFWSECVIEDAKECFALAGFSIKDIYFSGFSSQGDGARFVGSWRASDVKPGALKDHAPQDTKLHAIAAEVERIAAAFPGATASITNNGRYCHEYCSKVEPELNAPEDDDGEARTTAEWAALAEARAPYEEAIIEAARDAMRWIYSTLEKEWDYQNSDEQVDENIRINEYDFLEDGTRA